MFGIGAGELIVIVFAVLIIIGPKKLPEAMRSIGQFVGKLAQVKNEITKTVDDEKAEIEAQINDDLYIANVTDDFKRKF